MQPVVLIECPRLLFPFAREIVATSVRNGGFPPLMLDPVDFVALYRQRLAQQAGARRPSRRRFCNDQARTPARMPPHRGFAQRRDEGACAARSSAE